MDKISPFSTVKAEHVNKLVDEVNKLNNIAVSPPLELNRTYGGFQLRITEQGFTAAIVGTSSSSSSSSGSSGSSVVSHVSVYSVAEVCADPSVLGGWIFRPGGRTLNKCVYEWNHTQDIPAGTIVWVEPFAVNDWRFVYSSFSNVSSSTSSSSSSSSLSIITKSVVVDVICVGGVITPVYENICCVVCPSSSSSSS